MREPPELRRCCAAKLAGIETGPPFSLEMQRRMG
jgi:hypothetical protein